MKIREPDFKWDEDNGLSILVIYDDKNRAFTGIAECHKDDSDMKNEKTGYEIALQRAELSLYKQHIKDLKAERKVLQTLCSTYKAHPKFNKEDWEFKILAKKIASLSEDIATFQGIVKQRQYDLDAYLRMKDGFYQKVRKIREKKKAKD